MKSCDHTGYRRYTRRVFSNGSIHICVQCTRCLALVKMPDHGDRPFFRIDEVPAGKTIHEWMDSAEGLI